MVEDVKVRNTTLGNIRINDNVDPFARAAAESKYSQGRIDLSVPLLEKLGLSTYQGENKGICVYYWENARKSVEGRASVYRSIDEALNKFFNDKDIKVEPKDITTKFMPEVIDSILELMMLMADLEKINVQSGSNDTRVGTKYTDLLINNKTKLINEYFNTKMSDGLPLVVEPMMKAPYLFFLAENAISTGKASEQLEELKLLDELKVEIDKNVPDSKKNQFNLRLNLIKAANNSALLEKLSADKDEDKQTIEKYKTNIRNCVEAIPDPYANASSLTEKEKYEALVLYAYSKLTLFGIDKSDANKVVLIQLLSDSKLQNDVSLLDDLRLALAEYYVDQKPVNTKDANIVLSQITNQQGPRFKLAKSNSMLSQIRENFNSGKEYRNDISVLKSIIGTNLTEDYFNRIDSPKIRFYLKQNQLEMLKINGDKISPKDLANLVTYAADDKTLLSLAHLFSANYHLDQVVDENDAVNLNATTVSLRAVPEDFQKETDYKLAHISMMLKAKSDHSAIAIIKTFKYADLTERQKLSFNLVVLELANLLKVEPNDSKFLDKLKDDTGQLIPPPEVVTTLEVQAKSSSKDQITVNVLRAVNLLNRKLTKDDDVKATELNFNTLLAQAEVLLTNISDSKDKAKEQNNIDLLRGLGHFQRREYGHASEKFMKVINFYFEDNDNNKTIKQMNDKERNEYLRTLGVYIATYLKANKAPGSSLKLDDIKLDTLLPSTFVGQDSDLKNIKLSYELDLMFAKREYKTIINDEKFSDKFKSADEKVKQKLQLIKGFAHLYAVSGEPDIKEAKENSDIVAGADIADVDNKILLLSLDQEIKYADKSDKPDADVEGLTKALNSRIEGTFKDIKLNDHQITQLVAIYRKYLQRTGQDTKTFDELIGSDSKLPNNAPFIYQLAVKADKYDIEMKSNVVDMKDFIKNFPAQAKDRLDEVGKLDLVITDKTTASDVSENVSSLRQVQRFDRALALIIEALKKLNEQPNANLNKERLNTKKELLKLQIEIKLDLIQLKKPAERETDVKDIERLISDYSKISDDSEVKVEVVLQSMALATAEGKSVIGSNGKLLSEFSIANFPQRNQNVFKFRYQMMLAYNKMAQKGFSDYATVKRDIDKAFIEMPIVDQTDYKEAKMGVYVRMVDSAKGDYKVARLTEKDVTLMSWDQAATLLSVTKSDEALTLLDKLTKATPVTSFVRIKATLAGYSGDNSWVYVDYSYVAPPGKESQFDNEPKMGLELQPGSARVVAPPEENKRNIPLASPASRVSNSTLEVANGLSVEANSSQAVFGFGTADEMFSYLGKNNVLIEGINAQRETVTKTGTWTEEIPIYEEIVVENETGTGTHIVRRQTGTRTESGTYTWNEEVLTPHDFGKKAFDKDAQYLKSVQEIIAKQQITKEVGVYAFYRETKDIKVGDNPFEVKKINKGDIGNMYDTQEMGAGVTFDDNGNIIKLEFKHYEKDVEAGNFVAGNGKYYLIHKPPVENQLNGYISKELSEKIKLVGAFQVDDIGQHYGKVGFVYEDKKTGKISVFFTTGEYAYFNNKGTYDSVKSNGVNVSWEKMWETKSGAKFLAYLNAGYNVSSSSNPADSGASLEAGLKQIVDLGEGASVTTGVVATVQQTDEGLPVNLSAGILYRDNLKRFVENNILGTNVSVPLSSTDKTELETLLGLTGKRAQLGIFNAERYKGAFKFEVVGSADGGKIYTLICKDRKSFNEMIAEIGKTGNYQLASTLLEANLRSKLEVFKQSNFDGVSTKEVAEYEILLGNLNNIDKIYKNAEDKAAARYGLLKSIDPLANTLLAKISYQISVQYILAQAFVLKNGGDTEKSNFDIKQLEQLMANVKLSVDDLNILGFDTQIKVGSSLVNILTHPEALLNVGVECIQDFRINENNKFRLGGELSTFDPHLHAELLMEFNNKFTVSLGNNLGVEVLDKTGAAVKAGVKVDLLGLFGYGRAAFGLTYGNAPGSALHGGEVTWAMVGVTGLIIRKEKNPGHQFRFADGEIVSAVDYFGKTNYKMLAATVGSEHFNYLKNWAQEVCKAQRGLAKISIFYDQEDAAKLYSDQRVPELELFKKLVTELYKRKANGNDSFKALNAVFLNWDVNKFEGDTFAVDMDSLKKMVRDISKGKGTADALINEYLNNIVHTERVNAKDKLIKAVLSSNASNDLKKSIEKLINDLSSRGLEFNVRDEIINKIANNNDALVGLNKMLSVFENELEIRIPDMVLTLDDSGFLGFFRNSKISQYYIEMAYENLKSVGKDKDDISENDILNKLRGEVGRINYVDKNLASLMAMLEKKRIDADLSYIGRKDNQHVFLINMRGAGKNGTETQDYEFRVTDKGAITLFQIFSNGVEIQEQIDSQKNVFHRALYLMCQGGGIVPSAIEKMFKTAKINAIENSKVEQSVSGQVIDQDAIDRANATLATKTTELENKSIALAALRQSIINLTARLGEVNADLDALRPELAKLEQEVADLTAELESMKEDAKKKQEALDLAKQKVAALQPEVDKLIRDIAAEEATLDVGNKKIPEFNAEIKKKQDASSALNVVAEKLEGNNKAVIRLEGLLKTTRDQIGVEKAKFNDWKPFNEDQDKVDRLEREERAIIATLSAKREDVKISIKAKDDVAALQIVIDGLNKQVSAQVEANIASQKSLDALNIDLKSKQPELTSAQESVAKLGLEVPTLNAKALDLGKQVEQKQALVADAQNRIEDKEKIKEGIEQELAKAKLDLPGLIDSVKKAEAQVAAARKAVSLAEGKSITISQPTTKALPVAAKAVTTASSTSKAIPVAANTSSQVQSIRTQLGGISTPSVFNRSMDIASDRPWTDLDKLEDVTDIEFIQAVVYLTRNQKNPLEANIANAEAIKQGTLNWNVNFAKLMKHYNVSDKKELVYIAVAKKMKDMRVTENKEELKKELDKISDREVRKKLVDILVHKFKVNVDIPKVETEIKPSRRSPSLPPHRR